MTTTTKPMVGVETEKPTGVVATLAQLPIVGKFVEPARDVAFTFATDYRGYFVMFFVLPMSLLFDLWYRMRAKYVYWRNSAPQDHDKRVAKISANLKELYDRYVVVVVLIVAACI
jgi:predicted PurR-regulated permease PerM